MFSSENIAEKSEQVILMLCGRYSFHRLLLVIGFVLLLAGCSDEDANELYQQGVTAMDADKPDEAIIWFKKALQLDPEMALIHYRLGQIYHKKGNGKQAYAQLGRAVLQDPTLAAARKEIIFLLVENRALEQAVKVCEEYLEKNGDDEEVYLILGNSLAYLKKLDEAVGKLELATEKFPENLKIKVNLSKLLVVAGNVKDGRFMLENLVKENPNDIELQIALAQMYIRIERYDLALLSLEALKDKKPENPKSYQLLAQLALMKNKVDTAKNVLLEAEDVGVKDSNLFRMHAMIYHREGDSVNGLKYYEKAADSATEETRQTNQMILVEYHSFLKNYKKAQGILENVIAQGATNKGLKSRVVELFLAQGEYDQAKNSVDALLKEDSGNARGHFLKGLMMMKDKDVTEAREQFSKARELDPDDAANQFLYGLTFKNESQDISITEIGEALKKNPNLMKARVALAELFAKKGDFQASLDEIDKVIENDSDNVGFRAFRISVLLKMGKAELAVEDAQLLVKREPEKIWHKFRLAEIYFITKRYEEALPLYKDLLEGKPDSVQILNRLVGLSMLQKDPENAIRLADTFLSKYPDNGPAILVKAKIHLSQGQLDLAENILVPVADKGSEVAPIVILADLYRLKAEAENAKKYYNKALELAPENIGLRMKLADFYLKNGELADAIESYETVLKQKADFLPAMNNLAFLYADKKGNLERALELATAVSKRLPKNSDVADTLGWIYVLKKDYVQAEPYLHIALDAKPDNSTIVYHMGMLRFGQNNIQEAERLLTEAIQKGIKGVDLEKANKALGQLVHAKVNFQKAVAAKERGSGVEAIKLFEEILEDEGFSTDVAANLAVLYAEQDKDINKAFALAQKAFDVQPVSSQVADALGWVYYHQGSLLMAKKYVEQAIEKDESYGPAYLHLGAVYLKKENPEAAKKALETAKKMDLSVAEVKMLEALMGEISKE